MTTHTAPAATTYASHCAPCDARIVGVLPIGGRVAVAMEYEPDGYTVSGIRHVCWPRDQRIGRLILARRAAAQTALAA